MDAAHRQLAGASSGSGGGQTDTESAVLLNNLLPALLQTFAVVLLGYVSARWRLIPAGSDTVLGAYTATFALPALIFQNMASLNLGQASVGLLLGVLAAKSAVAIVVALFTLILVGTGGGGGSGGAQHTWSLAALFAMATTQQNDFALGLPVLDALYPPKVLPPECGLDPVPVVWLAQQAAGVCTPQLQMSDYLYLFAPISLLVINPICFAVLELANALTRRRAQQRSGNGGSGGGGGGGSICSCRFLLRQVLLPTLTNPVVFCVALGAIANVTHLPLPSFATDALRTVGSSFSSLALFCLGMSLGLKSEPAEASAVGDQLEGDEPDAGRGGADSAPLSQLAAAPQNETHALDGCVQPLLLVAAKSLLLPIVARFVVYAITHSEFVARFAFVYCTFPAAPSVYLFAVRYGMPAPDLKRLSFTTVAGTMVSAPIMFVSAEMAMLDLNSESAEQLTATLRAAEKVGYGALVGAIWLCLLTSSMLLQRGQRGSNWRRQHLVWSVFFLAVCQCAYLVLATVCSPQHFRDRYPAAAQHCALGTEGMTTGARIWGVILLVSDVHRAHRAAATGRVWVLLRGAKHIVLWVAWILPTVWVISLRVSGVWERLSLACYACFNSEQPSAATVSYRLASSSLAAGLSVVALGVLVWAQRQPTTEQPLPLAAAEAAPKQRPSLQEALLAAPAALGTGQAAPPDAQAPTATAQTVLSLQASEGARVAPSVIWSSTRLRVVGLWNVLGMLFQVAVGVDTLIEPKQDGVSFEIIVLNHFGLFSQGLASGLLLGSLPEAPLVRACSAAGRWCWSSLASLSELYVAPLVVYDGRPRPGDWAGLGFSGGGGDVASAAGEMEKPAAAVAAGAPSRSRLRIGYQSLGVGVPN